MDSAQNSTAEDKHKLKFVTEYLAIKGNGKYSLGKLKQNWTVFRRAVVHIEWSFEVEKKGV